MVWSIESAPTIPEGDYVEWRVLLEERVGMRLGIHQKQLLQTHVAIRMREIGEHDYSAYLKHVKNSKTGQLEWAVLVDRLVVKETSFLRHKASFNYVCGHLQDRINNKSLNGSYDVWSLGCSTGEEAYTLAMMINEILELAQIEPYFGITATDISRFAISRARAGYFNKLDFLSSALRFKYFSEEKDGYFKFYHEVAEKICFAHANVLRVDEMPKLNFDVIFCQNMLVYFRQPLRRKLLDSIVEKLKPGGLLVLGLGEVTNWVNPYVTRVARADVQVYVRRASNEI